VFFGKKRSRKFKFHYNLTKITGTFYEDVSTFVTPYHRILLRMINVSNKIVQKIRAHFTNMLNFYFFPKNHAVYEIMWKSNVQSERTYLLTYSMEQSPS